jgi:hypothetical protein
MALRLDGAGPRRAEGLRKARCVLPDPRLVAGRAGAVVLPADRRRGYGGRPLAHVLLPRVRAVRLIRPAHARPAHPGGAPISSLVPLVSCRRCSPPCAVLASYVQCDTHEESIANQMPSKLPQWQRVSLVAGLIVLAAALGLFAYSYVTRPLTLTVRSARRTRKWFAACPRSPADWRRRAPIFV